MVLFTFMLAASSFRRSRLSWFRCAYCDAATYAATSRTILSREHPKVTVEYKCECCGRLSTLRNPSLMNVGLPFAVAACAFLLVYNVLLKATAWYSLSAISVIGVIVGVEVVVWLVVSRFAKRFDRA
jgi:hypothetical protein